MAKSGSRPRHPVTDGVSIGGARRAPPGDLVHREKGGGRALETFEQPAERGDPAAGRRPQRDPPDGPVDPDKAERE